MKDENGEYGRVTITALYSFDLGTQYWEDYFAKQKQ